MPQLLLPRFVLECVDNRIVEHIIRQCWLKPATLPLAQLVYRADSTSSARGESNSALAPDGGDLDCLGGAVNKQGRQVK